MGLATVGHLSLLINMGLSLQFVLDECISSIKYYFKRRII